MPRDHSRNDGKSRRRSRYRSKERSRNNPSARRRSRTTRYGSIGQLNADLVERIAGFAGYETHAVLRIVFFNVHKIVVELQDDPSLPTHPNTMFWKPKVGRTTTPDGRLVYGHENKTIEPVDEDETILNNIVEPFVPYEPQPTQRSTKLSYEIASWFRNEYGLTEFPTVHVDLEFGRENESLIVTKMRVTLEFTEPYVNFVGETTELTAMWTIAGCVALQATWFYFRFGTYPMETKLPWYPRTGPGNEAYRVTRDASADSNSHAISLGIFSRGSNLTTTAALAALLDALGPNGRLQST